MKEHARVVAGVLGAGGGLVVALVLWLLLKTECTVGTSSFTTDCVQMFGIDYSPALFAGGVSFVAAGLGVLVQEIASD